MGTPRLIDADYWESDEIDIRLNPRRNFDIAGLSEFLTNECGISSSVVMATSGSSGAPKYVVLSKTAILASAAAVNRHCSVTGDDVWLAGLSDFHVGGLGIFARAHLAGSQVVRMSVERWDRTGSTLIREIEEESATITSLTPTHLFDLVSNEQTAPESLRGVLLGGGRIRPGLVERARDLDWPIWPTYGLTEACSQVATSVEGDPEWLPILDCWRTKVEDDERLSLYGPALLTGYALRLRGRWYFTKAKTGGGWFKTGDYCELKENKLRFRSRADDLVKISGELLSITALNDLAIKVASEFGTEAAIIDIPNPRRETEIVLVVAGKRSIAEKVRESFNLHVGGLETVKRVVPAAELPRTEIGKVDRASLRKMVHEEQGDSGV